MRVCVPKLAQRLPDRKQKISVSPGELLIHKCEFWRVRACVSLSVCVGSGVFTDTAGELLI